MAGDRGGLAAGLAGAVVLVMVAVVVLLTMGGAGASPSDDAAGTCTVSVTDEADRRRVEELGLVDIYQAASNRYQLGPRGPATLAAINMVESGFGDGREHPIYGPPTRHGRAEGPMQFLPSTWEMHGVDGNGDGTADPQDPADAIHSAANYLHASGAPADWEGAIHAYNHSDAYVRQVMENAELYLGACSGGVTPGTRPWTVAVPGTTAECDARIVDDVKYLIDRFHLALGDCYSLDPAHTANGEHPLGLAIDVTPADGNWDNTMAAARFLGWDESCASRGCPNPVARWIGYNGVADHGDPSHCTGDCPPHLHVSWNHAEAAYDTPAAWVTVWELPTGDPDRLDHALLTRR